MEKAKVAILMSTYNGEKYLSQQIDSIINQTFTSWELYIRDDGSTDRTIDIIKKYTVNEPRIKLFNEGVSRNLGVTRSFLKMLEKTDAEYYMFSDQDDVWLPSKVKDTLGKMQEYDGHTPVCVYTNLQSVDRYLNPIRQVIAKPWQAFPYMLFTNNAYGCTMMINQPLKDLVKFKKLDYDRVVWHDYWLALLASLFGNLVCLNKPTILYRQHEGNQVGAPSSTISSRFKRFLDTKNGDGDRNNLKDTVKHATELSLEYDLSNVNNQDYMYIKSYSDLRKNSSFVHNFIVGLKYPPKSIHPLKTAFYMYILVRYNQDFLSL